MRRRRSGSGRAGGRDAGLLLLFLRRGFDIPPYAVLFHLTSCVFPRVRAERKDLGERTLEEHEGGAVPVRGVFPLPSLSLPDRHLATRSLS